MKKSDNIRIVSWNLGNALYPASYSYVKSQSSVRVGNVFPTSKKEVMNNINGQIEILREIDADIMLFQEITKLQPQNHYANIYKKFINRFTSYRGFFCSTFNIMNLINHGKATFMKYDGYNYVIKSPHKLKGYINNKLFANAKSIVTRIAFDKKELVIINIHLTAFERSRVEREKQLEYIFNYGRKEYEKGNYVIIGGDFNIDLGPNDRYSNHIGVGSQISRGVTDIFETEKWQLVYPNSPTHRDLGKPYDEKISQFSTIDGFLVSSDIEVINISAINDFRFSDHAPVVIDVKLK